MPTPQLIQNIRHSIEVLLSIKNDQGNGNQMNSSMINDESGLNQSSNLSARQLHRGSPQSTNPFDRVKVKDDFMMDKNNKQRNEKSKDKQANGQNSIKSQSLFSNYYSGKSFSFGRHWDPCMPTLLLYPTQILTFFIIRHKQRQQRRYSTSRREGPDRVWQ